MIPAVCNREMMDSAAGTATHPRVIHKSGGKSHRSWAEYKLDLFIFSLQKLCVGILFHFLGILIKHTG